MPPLLEVCVDSFESAVAAMEGGAHRLELCASLHDGGLTPTAGLLVRVQAANTHKIPVHCLVRCRAGGFVYTLDELEVMREDTKVLRSLGADGIVFGALLTNGDVDMKTCREIFKAAHPLPMTFHRAFDFCRRPTIEIEVIIDLGFKRILTSGKQPTAQLGVKLIRKLMEQVENRIIIMPGADIGPNNVKFILEHTEAKELHGTFKKVKETSAVAKCEDAAKRDDDEPEILLEDEKRPTYITDVVLVKQMVQLIADA